MTVAVAEAPLPEASAPAADGWGARRRLTLTQARRRTRLIHALRFVFIGLAVASLASVFVYATAHSVAGGFRIERPDAATPEITMLQPRFTGRLSEELSYQLTADQAVRATAEEGPITLQGPVYREETGRLIVAPNGEYDPLAGRIVLTGGVSFSADGVDRFSSSTATIDLENRVVRGETEIVGEGPLGVVRADAYELRDGDGVIVLRGRVSGILPE